MNTITTTVSAANSSLFQTCGHNQYPKFSSTVNHTRPHRRSFCPLHVVNDANKTDVSSDPTVEKSDADRLVDGLNFGELCNEFECNSSPQVKSTARQLVRDILELREGNRAFNIYALSVKYKDPVRSFTGRQKYKRPLWITDALDNVKVAIQEMEMLSTSVLNIKWRIRGKPKSFLASIGGDLVIKVDSKFTLNQISGQVLEHEETWDLSTSSPVAKAYFWASRRLFATKEAGMDVVDSVKDLSNKVTARKENIEIYPDPSGDPAKFFQRDDSFQRDMYQIALFFAIVYFVVKFLKLTL